MSDYLQTHVVRGGMVLAAALAGYIGWRFMFVPEGFGEDGHYRTPALAEIRAQEPLFQGREVCNECHDDILDLVAKDTHHSVNCEDCHGTAGLHVAFQMGEDDEGITEEQAALPKIKDRALCLLCHRKLQARPSTFPQIDPGQHPDFLRLTADDVECVECHDPHEPIFLLTEASAARLHPVIQECFHCHDPVPAEPMEDVPDHPPVLMCNYCHDELSADFEERPHSFVKCGTCHQFTQVTDTVGRIFKNGSVRFCLLCHEEKPFKDAEAVPMLRWPDHLDDEKIEGADRDKTCIECHWEQIHTMQWAETGQGGDR